MILKKMQQLLASLRPSTNSGNTRSSVDQAQDTSRRSFFKKAAVGAVAVTGTAELAKVTASSISDTTAQQLYEKDVLAGDRVLSERDYVVMSDQEKNDMVQGFIDDYRNGS